MGHSGHSHALGHDHGHEVVHFPYCTDPRDCFCEVNRYLFAMASGVFFALTVYWLSRERAGSYGAEGDAWHIFSDALFMLVSAFLAWWKHDHKSHERIAEVIGIIANTAFLLVAAGVIVYNVWLGESYRQFSAGWMVVAGLVGLVGNLSQFVILKEDLNEKSEDERKAHISILSVTKQHVFYDLVNSVVVVAAGLIATALPLSYAHYVDGAIANLIAFAMVWSGYMNIRKLHVKVGHH